MYDSSLDLQSEQWVIWNGSFGVLDTVNIGLVEPDAKGRVAWLEEPYDMVGPFCLDELEANGRIRFAACIIMSRQRWQLDQVALRREALRNRRVAQDQVSEEQARYNAGRGYQQLLAQQGNDRLHRESLKLPIRGQLKPEQIKAAFRRLAQKVHPDMGGSHDQFVKITEARNALLDWIPSQSR